MNDIAYVAMIFAFFALTALFVKACDRIIGPDEQSAASRTGSASDDDNHDDARLAA
jgi:hypothetical protein